MTSIYSMKQRLNTHHSRLAPCSASFTLAGLAAFSNRMVLGLRRSLMTRDTEPAERKTGPAPPTSTAPHILSHPSGQERIQWHGTLQLMVYTMENKRAVSTFTFSTKAPGDVMSTQDYNKIMEGTSEIVN